MTIEYKIDKNDFLTHQLYGASKSERIKKKRHRNKIVVPLIYISGGLLLILLDDNSLGITFLIIAPLWFFLYPIWERILYIKHYNGFIEENYKEKIGQITTLEISNEYLYSKNNGSESKVLTTEIEEIIEIRSIIFIRLKGGHSFILPKGKIADIENVITRLKELAVYLKIKYEIQESWEWK